jgi:hypothetical protein
VALWPNGALLPCPVTNPETAANPSFAARCTAEGNAPPRIMAGDAGAYRVGAPLKPLAFSTPLLRRNACRAALVARGVAAGDSLWPT